MLYEGVAVQWWPAWEISARVLELTTGECLAQLPVRRDHVPGHDGLEVGARDDHERQAFPEVASEDLVPNAPVVAHSNPALGAGASNVNLPEISRASDVGYEYYMPPRIALYSELHAPLFRARNSASMRCINPMTGLSQFVVYHMKTPGKDTG
ncbi:hypothetical protein Mapa_004924 [Marchantia paleacea]|nr:hypothetical protein Mapa_004924 [Marchantia paleacea]